MNNHVNVCKKDKKIPIRVTCLFFSEKYPRNNRNLCKIILTKKLRSDSDEPMRLTQTRKNCT